LATITPRERTEWRVTCAARPKHNRVFKRQPAAAAYAQQLTVDEHLQAHAVRITEHTETVWLVRVRCKGAPDVSKTFGRQSDAKDWARKIEGDIAQRQFVDHRKADHTTLASILQRYEKDRLAHRRHGHPDRTRVRRLASLPIACRPLSSLKPSDFVSFRDERLQEVKGATVRKDLEMVSRVIAVAMREWDIHLPLNPASGRYYKWPEPQAGDARDRRLKLVHSATPAPLESGKREARRDAAAKTTRVKCHTPWVIQSWVVAWMQMPQTEEQAILRACRYPNWFQPKKATAKPSSVRERAWRARRTSIKYRHREGMRLWAYVSLALETGLRRGELLHVRWSHVNLEVGILDLPASITKNKLPRLIPLTLRAWRILQTQPKVGDLVFGYKPDSVSQAWDRARKRACSPDLRLHDLRHEATSRLFERTTLRDSEIGSITGHTDPRMLQRYYNKRPEECVKRFHDSFRDRQAMDGAPAT